MDTLPTHIFHPMYTAAPNAQLLTETVPVEFVSKQRTHIPKKENNPDYWINRGLIEHPDPCWLTGIKFSLMECNRCHPIIFQEHHNYSQGLGTELHPQSLDLNTMTAMDIIWIIEISDHQTEEIYINQHT
jgi:hypothetical protein